MKEKTEINKFGLPNIVIPAEVLFCEGLTSTEKILFGFINNLSYTEDGCWASNRYLGKLAGVRPETISAMLSKLQKLGFLKIEYYTKPNGTNIRKIFIDKEYLTKYEETLQVKYKELNEDMPLKKPGKQKAKPYKGKIEPISKRKNPIKETLNPPKEKNKPSLSKNLTKIDKEIDNEVEKDLDNKYSASNDAQHTGSSIFPPKDIKSSPQTEPTYITYKGKKLSGKKLEMFLTFWETFGDKRNKAKTADAWLEIKNLEAVYPEIIEGAKKYANIRPALLLKKLTPKMAEGWLRAKRWEDEIDEIAESISLRSRREVQNAMAVKEFLEDGR